MSEAGAVLIGAAGLLGAGLCSIAGALVLVARGSPPVPAERPTERPAQYFSGEESSDGSDAGRAVRPRRRHAQPAVSPRKANGQELGAEASAASRVKELQSLDRQLADDDAAIRNGFSMEDAAEYSSSRAVQARAQTPATVLDSLQRGNTRFWMGVASRPEVSAFERRALIMKQHPSVAILGCSDSRVPIEIVFDQGLGDIFVIRVAGNCLDKTTVGSLEYAAVYLGVKVLMVMGHEGCGAVRAAQLPMADIEKEPESLSSLLKSLKAGLDEGRLSQVHDTRACDREAVTSNVHIQVEALMMNEVVRSRVDKQELIVCGAFYDMSSGIVDFFLPEEDRGCGQCVQPGADPPMPGSIAPASPKRVRCALARPTSPAPQMFEHDLMPP